MLDNPVAHRRRQQINHRSMNRRRRREGPAVFPFALHDVHDAVGELLENAPIVFDIDSGALGDRVPLPGRRAAWESARLIGKFVLITPMRVRRIERLDQLEARAAGRRFINLVRFQRAAIRYDDQRCRCHDNAKCSSQNAGGLVR